MQKKRIRSDRCGGPTNGGTHDTILCLNDQGQWNHTTGTWKEDFLNDNPIGH